MKHFASSALAALAAIQLGLMPCPSAMAADNSSQAETPAPSPTNIQLAKKFMDEIHLTDLMKNVMSTMIPVMTEQEKKDFPSITDKQLAIVDGAVLDSSSDLVRDVIDRMIPLYASTFTEQELKDLVSFYGTPSGQAMLAKMPALMSRAAPIMRELTPKYQAEIRQRICLKLECNSDGKLAAPQIRD
jgi:hypothetical protein